MLHLSNLPLSENKKNDTKNNCSQEVMQRNNDIVGWNWFKSISFKTLLLMNVVANAINFPKFKSDITKFAENSEQFRILESETDTFVSVVSFPNNELFEQISRRVIYRLRNQTGKRPLEKKMYFCYIVFHEAILNLNINQRFFLKNSAISDINTLISSEFRETEIKNEFYDIKLGCLSLLDNQSADDFIDLLSSVFSKEKANNKRNLFESNKIYVSEYVFMFNKNIEALKIVYPDPLILVQTVSNDELSFLKMNFIMCMDFYQKDFEELQETEGKTEETKKQSEDIQGQAEDKNTASTSTAIELTQLQKVHKSVENTHTQLQTFFEKNKINANMHISHFMTESKNDKKSLNVYDLLLCEIRNLHKSQFNNFTANSVDGPSHRIFFDHKNFEDNLIFSFHDCKAQMDEILVDIKIDRNQVGLHTLKIIYTIKIINVISLGNGITSITVGLFWRDPSNKKKDLNPLNHKCVLINDLKNPNVYQHIDSEDTKNFLKTINSIVISATDLTHFPCSKIKDLGVRNAIGKFYCDYISEIKLIEPQRDFNELLGLFKSAGKHQEIKFSKWYSYTKNNLDFVKTNENLTEIVQKYIENTDLYQFTRLCFKEFNNLVSESTDEQYSTAEGSDKNPKEESLKEESFQEKPKKHDQRGPPRENLIGIFGLDTDGNHFILSIKKLDSYNRKWNFEEVDLDELIPSEENYRFLQDYNPEILKDADYIDAHEKLFIYILKNETTSIVAKIKEKMSQICFKEETLKHNLEKLLENHFNSFYKDENLEIKRNPQIELFLLNQIKEFVEKIIKSIKDDHILYIFEVIRIKNIRKDPGYNAKSRDFSKKYCSLQNSALQESHTWL